MRHGGKQDCLQTAPLLYLLFRLLKAATLIFIAYSVLYFVTLQSHFWLKADFDIITSLEHTRIPEWFHKFFYKVFIILRPKRFMKPSYNCNITVYATYYVVYAMYFPITSFVQTRGPGFTLTRSWSWTHSTSTGGTSPRTEIYIHN